PEALGIQPVTYDIFIHPRRDPGVFKEAHNFLRQHANLYKHALVIFDCEGCGSQKTSVELENQVKQNLAEAGWQDRAEVVVIDPELEAWVFSKSPHVAKVIADDDGKLLENMLANSPKNSLGKPERPKELMEDILKRKSIPRSASLYFKLAESVSFNNCKDSSFLKFRNVLQKWFKRS
ncbi:MAG: methylation-associated defense system protein MAD4, partial [Pyrinomonadaceae bacterium]